MDNEFIINFTDITLNETDGIFEDTKKIMLNETPRSDKWVLRSFITIVSNSGEGSMEIQCHGDKNIYILDYEPSIGDLYYNPDIQAISMWAQENGWNIPQPHPDLIKSNKEFWKYFYDTLVIDSDYLDKLYGGRPQIDGSK
jgi:hypothetical protein